MAQPEDSITTAPPAGSSGGGGSDLLPLVVAIYGAVVATGVAVYQFVRDRPGVKVRLIPLVLLKPRQKPPPEFWSVTVVNHRTRGITIQSAGLLVDGKERSYPKVIDPAGDEIQRPFPVKLDDGEIVEIYTSHDRGSKVSGAWARDALGSEYLVRYPSLQPLERFRNWRYRRELKKQKRERTT